MVVGSRYPAHPPGVVQGQSPAPPRTVRAMTRAPSPFLPSRLRSRTFACADAMDDVLYLLRYQDYQTTRFVHAGCGWVMVGNHDGEAGLDRTPRLSRLQAHQSEGTGRPPRSGWGMAASAL